MGSNYFGELNNLRKESSSSSTSSPRKGKKKKSGNNSEKQPKQPQRGLGVAQLEKIRLHSRQIAVNAAAAAGYNINPSYPNNFPDPQEDVRVERPYISSSPSYLSYSTSLTSSYGFDAPQTIMMTTGKGETETTYVSYNGDSQPCFNMRWNAGKTVPGVEHSQQPQLITRQLLDLEAEEATSGKNKKARGDSMGSGSAVSGSSNSQELDLELRLSL